ncbi:MAG TPA: hypothetical protein VI750_04120 [Pyrinomonadaceae bacterium]|nr:hypothetical protein [Pyrinomonadaceae bacterium]
MRYEIEAAREPVKQASRRKNSQLDIERKEFERLSTVHLEFGSPSSK